MTTMQVQTTPLTDATLPDGDALGNDILASMGSAQVKAMLKKNGKPAKSRQNDPDAPRIMFTPRAWSMGGRVD